MADWKSHFFSYGLETLAQALLNAFVAPIQKFTLPFLSCTLKFYNKCTSFF
jgi:hypothetical protein